MTFAAGFLCLTASSIVGAESDFSSGILDRQAAVAAATSISTNEYPDADEVLVAGQRRVDYTAEGTYTEWSEEFIKVLTEKGRRNYRTLSSYFTIPYQRGPKDCQIPLLEIIRPDGTAVPVDVEKQSRIMINPGSMSANIYNPNAKVIQVNVSDLEVGDVLHFVMFDRIVQSRMRDTWCDWFVLESSRPIVSEIIEVHAPQERPLQSILLKDEIKGTVTYAGQEEGGRIRHRWEAHNVPQMFPEPNMPPLHTVVQRLLVSTAPDWQTVSRWYWNLCEPHLVATPAMKAQVEALTRGLEDPRRKMEAVFRFVAQQIRYMGITVEATAPGFEPHDVKDTFEARHGVCRDKAALLVALLRLAGFEAFPVLIETGTKKDPEVPQPYFNHAITAVREAPDRYLLMDATDETAAEFLPAYLNDKSYLVATPEGDRLRTSPIDPAERNLMRIDTAGVVDFEGRLSAETVLRFEGVNDNAYRGWFARSRPEERHRFFEGLMKAAVPGARVRSLELLPADMMDVSTALTARVRFEADAVVVRGQGLSLLPLPAMGTRVGMVNFIIGQTGLKERKYPLQTEMACGVRERITLNLPPPLATPEFLPTPDPVDTNTVSWQFGVRQSNGVLTAEADFRLKVTEFKPDEYQALKDTLKKTEQDLKEMPGYPAPDDPLERLAQGADAIVLDETVEYNLDTERRWTERRTVSKKILTYAGKKANSELKIAYNTAWEDVKLEWAAVTAADGTKKEISAKEINVMDAPWVGSARRYPPGRILVASFPAVEIGSTIDYAYIRTCQERPFFARLELFRSADPLASKTVRITAPPSLALRDVILNGAVEGGATQESSGGSRVYEWTAHNVPLIKREEMLPPGWTFSPAVFVTTGTWREYAKAVNRALMQACTDQAGAEKKARELVGTEPDLKRKIERIRDFVAIHVRDVGPLLSEAPLDAVTPADRTLADGYGNSTDRAVLLHALLKAAGLAPDFILVPAEPLIGDLAERMTALPYPPFLGQVLVRLRGRRLLLPEGTSLYLNDTDQYAPIGASSHAGQCGFSLPGGQIETISPAEPDKVAVSYALAVSADGNTRLSKTVSLFGNDCAAEHRRLAEMTPEEKRRHNQELIAEVSQAAESRDELRTDFSRSPGTIEFTVDIPHYAVRDGNYLYVTLPAMFEHLLELQADTRINPLYRARSQARDVRLRIEAPAGFRARHLPTCLADRLQAAVAGAGNTVQLSAQEAGATTSTVVTVDGKANLLPAIVAPEQYPELLDLQEALYHKRNRTVVFEAVNEPAKAP